MKKIIFIQLTLFAILQQSPILGNEVKNFVIPQGVAPGITLEYTKAEKSARLQMKRGDGHITPIWQGEERETQAGKKRGMGYLPYPDMTLIQASLNENILAVLFEIELPSDDYRFGFVSHKPKFARIFQKGTDEKWNILASLYPASLWWDTKFEDISSISVISPSEFEIVFKRGWKLRAGNHITGTNPNIISVFNNTPETIDASNNNKIFKDLADEPIRRQFFYDSNNYILYLLDPNQKKVAFREAIWWPIHNEIDEFPGGGSNWFEERKRQEKARKENQVTELYGLHLPMPKKPK